MVKILKYNGTFWLVGLEKQAISCFDGRDENWYNAFGEASLVAQTVKCLPAMQETRVRFLGREDPLEKEMEIHSSTLAWKIPWTEEPDRLQSMGSQRVRHNWVTSLILLPLYLLVFRPRGIWDLSSLTGDQAHAPWIGRRSLNHWTAREVPHCFFKYIPCLILKNFHC